MISTTSARSIEFASRPIGMTIRPVDPAAQRRMLKPAARGSSCVISKALTALSAI